MRTPVFRSGALALALLLPGVATAAPPRASSEATDAEGVKHPAAHAFDGLLSTGWAEGALGDGAGAWIELRFDAPVDIASVSIFPGWLGGPNRALREHGRPKLVTLTFEVAGGEPVVKQERLLDPGEKGPLRHDVLIDVPKAKSVKLTIDEAFSGGLYSDTYVAEIALNLVGGAPPRPVVDVATWLASEPGQKAANAQRDAAVALFDVISGSEFGDRDKLQQLMDWAADGAPYLRERAAKVPAGFKLSAVQPDKTSIEALLKLKDANAIPAVERAALRSTGTLADDLMRRAKMFDAYQDLLGGAKRAAPPWGAPGIGKGALQALGEPLDIVLDAFGGLYVADTGNHRVNRYDLATGNFTKSWGAPEPQITEVWFYKTREAYAAGAAPGEEAGQFVNPVDLAVVTGKEGDGLLVLDAKARVTWIDPAGKVAKVQQLDTEGPIGPGIGGEGHVLYGKGKVVVVWGNEGHVLSAEDGSPLGKFTIEDGAPTSAVMFPNGKLGLVFGSQLILYSTDGFRHGDLLGDSLGTGFESWAVTLDEDGRLWALLDTGEVVKFKKPGKVDFRARIADWSLEVPRFAVSDDRVFVTTRDSILRVDALEASARGAAAGGVPGTLQIPEP